MLEVGLRERLRDSDDPYAQKRFFQVPLYLQELLFRVGQTDGSGYTTHPDNYDALVNACLALERVSFITLNYDTLLDQRLFIYSKLDSLVSYTNEKERWVLFKLHGSVNWGRQMNTAALVDAQAGTPVDFINRLFDERREGGVAGTITFRSKGTVEEMRYEGRSLFYPALSVPLGSADELICPKEHVDLLRDRTAGWIRK